MQASRRLLAETWRSVVDSFFDLVTLPPPARGLADSETFLHTIRLLVKEGSLLTIRLVYITTLFVKLGDSCPAIPFRPRRQNRRGKLWPNVYCVRIYTYVHPRKERYENVHKKYTVYTGGGIYSVSQSFSFPV